VGRGIGFVLWLLVCVLPVLAQPLPDKSQYTLTNRTPKELLRPLSPDRPDVTESAYTVDAGWLQLETDVLGFSREDGRTSWTLAPLNFKLGLGQNVDFQVGLTPYSLSDSNVEGVVSRETAVIPDVTLRVKVNLWGNDGGPTAFAVMPFITIPTRAGRVDGGLIFPLAVELSEGWGLGTMVVVAFVPNTIDDGYHTEFVNSLVLGHDLTAELGAFAEFVSMLSTEQEAPWMATVNAGLTYALSQNLLLDTGVRFGLTPAAPDTELFVGLTVRF